MPNITLNNKPSISFKINKDNQYYVILLEVGLNFYLDKIDNTSGSGVLIITCVSKDKPHHVHSNRLIGENCRSGVAVYHIKNIQKSISLKNLKIELTATNERKSQIEELKKNNVDPFIAGFDFDLQSIDIYNFRLCFQVFIKDKKNQILRDKYHILYPVLSEQIHVEDLSQNNTNNGKMLKLNTSLEKFNLKNEFKIINSTTPSNEKTISINENLNSNNLSFLPAHFVSSPPTLPAFTTSPNPPLSIINDNFIAQNYHGLWLVVSWPQAKDHLVLAINQISDW
ncbi:unnamed protein product [Brachionus calyciflorus]|uniref:RHD domain-containing protein n=1 Tax=Brachionus calyciflorus TaxID=104777 RepID=A0A813MSU0_9BILA|nr:unnamed protein product [Brachionus calyciflorus]